MKKPIAIALAAAFLLALAGCSSSVTAPQEPDLAASTATSVPVSVTATPTSVPEPLPAGYADLLEKKIASGDWTLETGLVTLLRMSVGEIPENEAGLGPGVLVTEGTGILQLAGEYIQSGTDEASRDEIARLLDVLVPSQEALDQYSIPREQASARGGPRARAGIPGPSGPGGVRQPLEAWLPSAGIDLLPVFHVRQGGNRRQHVPGLCPAGLAW